MNAIHLPYWASAMSVTPGKNRVSSQPLFSKPLFCGVSQLPPPTSMQSSLFVNDRLPIDGRDTVSSSIERLDEAMTVTGEVYSGNEAFTTLIGLKFKPGLSQQAQPSDVHATIQAQVEHAYTVSNKGKDMGFMVMSSEARASQSGTPFVTGKATFVAVDPASVHGGAGLKTVGVPSLTLHGAQEQQCNAEAAQWGQNLGGFYRQLAKRLNAQSPVSLASVASSPTRLINRNVYVTTHMLNKKGTGHGGIAAANAVKDMKQLVKNLQGSQTGAAEFVVEDMTASYLAPFYVHNALQFDTTLDHIDDQGRLYLSTRIGKLDTKKREAEGPIILVHSRIRPSAPVSWSFNATDSDAIERQKEAVQWAQWVG